MVPTEVVSTQEWNARREALLVNGKELTRARDALAAERRRLSIALVGKECHFEGRGGAVSLLDVFEGAPPNDRLPLRLGSRHDDRLLSAKRRRYTTRDDFSADFDVDQWFGINVFPRDGEQIYRSYYTTSRAAEELSSIWPLLDMTPFGWQKQCRDAPEGVTQGPTGSWVRSSDEFTTDELAARRTD
jgi:predicted dithiol-disulfide oxidoreductase (DUF899 family)